MNETEVHTAPDAEQEDRELAPTAEEVMATADEPGGEQLIIVEAEPAANAGDAERQRHKLAPSAGEIVARGDAEGQPAGNAPAEEQQTEPVANASDAEPQDEEPAPTREEIMATADEAGGEQLIIGEAEPAANAGDAELKAVLEAVIYITDEPLSADQMASALQQPKERISRLLDELVEDYARAERGLSIRELAGGYKMATKAEHHEALRAFVKNLKPALKLSLAALETLAVIAYKQPITAPEIMEIRGVQGAGVLKTLLDRKLITTAGRKIVVGKPILYKTTKEFLIQFGLKDLAELPTLKEFEELRRLAVSDSDVAEVAPDPDPEPKPNMPPEGDPPEEAPPVEEPPSGQPPNDPDKAPVTGEER